MQMLTDESSESSSRDFDWLCVARLVGVLIHLTATENECSGKTVLLICANAAELFPS